MEIDLRFTLKSTPGRIPTGRCLIYPCSSLYRRKETLAHLLARFKGRLFLDRATLQKGRPSSRFPGRPLCKVTRSHKGSRRIRLCQTRNGANSRHWILFRRMHSLISFRQSTPPKNRQLIICYYQSEYQDEGFFWGLTL